MIDRCIVDHTTINWVMSSFYSITDATSDFTYEVGCGTSTNASTILYIHAQPPEPYSWDKPEDLIIIYRRWWYWNRWWLWKKDLRELRGGRGMGKKGMRGKKSCVKLAQVKRPVRIAGIGRSRVWMS